MIENLLYVVIALGAIAVIIELVAFRRNAAVDLPRLWQTLDSIEKTTRSSEQSVREEMAKQADSLKGELAKLREEHSAAARQLRDEILQTTRDAEATLNQNIAQLGKAVEQKLQAAQADLVKQLAEVRAEALATAKTRQEETAKALAGIQETLAKGTTETAKLHQTQVEGLAAKLDKLAGTTSQQMDGLKSAIETQIRALQTDSTQRLEQLRTAGDEKLLATEKRLTESIRLASERIERAATRPVPSSDAGPVK